MLIIDFFKKLYLFLMLLLPSTVQGNDQAAQVIQSECLVVGAQNLGHNIAQEYINQNKPVDIFTPHAKDASKLASSPLVKIIQGNPDKDLNVLAQAAQNKKYLFFCPTYHYSKKWAKTMEAALTNLISVATATKATIVLPSKVFSVGVGHNKGKVTICEETDVVPSSKMGHAYKKLEQTLAQAANSGKCKAIILRHSHLFGPNIIDGLMDVQFRNAIKGSSLTWVNQIKHVGYQVAYAPNVAHVMVALAHLNQSEKSILLHYAGDLIDPIESFLRKISKGAGIAPEKFRVRIYSETEITIASYLNYDAEVCSDIFYIFKQTVALNDSRLKALLPDFKPISLDDAIDQSINWFRLNP